MTSEGEERPPSGQQQQAPPVDLPDVAGLQIRQQRRPQQQPRGDHHVRTFTPVPTPGRPAPQESQDSDGHRRWALAFQRPEEGIDSVPRAEGDTRLLLMPNKRVDYSHVVEASRPNWLGTWPGLSHNAETMRRLFPGCEGPLPRGSLYFGLPWHDVAPTLYDIEGRLIGKWWFDHTSIMALLRLSLACHQHCVFLFPQPISNNLQPSAVPRLEGEQRQESRQKRFWVMVCHIDGDTVQAHWSVVIYDQVVGACFYLDSDHGGPGGNIRDIQGGLVAAIERSGGLTQPDLRAVECPIQAQDWECGLWVVEFTRFFFQDIRTHRAYTPGQSWYTTRPYHGLTRGKAKTKMLNEWLKIVRLALGNAATRPLRNVAMRDSCKIDNPFESETWMPPGWETPREEIGSPLTRRGQLQSPTQGRAEGLEDEGGPEDDEVVAKRKTATIPDPQIKRPRGVTLQEGAEALLKGLGDNAARSPIFVAENRFQDPPILIDAALAALADEGLQGGPSDQESSALSSLGTTPVLSRTPSVERTKVVDPVESLWQATLEAVGDELPLQLWWIKHEATAWDMNLRRATYRRLKRVEQEQASSAQSVPAPSSRAPRVPKTPVRRSSRLTSRAATRPSGQQGPEAGEDVGEPDGPRNPEDPELGFERPSVYDHRGSPDCHLEPEYPAWWQGWIRMREEHAARTHRSHRHQSQKSRNDRMWRDE